VNGQPQSQQNHLQPYVRPRSIELEPAAFALSVLAVVMSIGFWKPLPTVQQAAPVEQVQTVAAAPRS
jgi:hypothetical protein